MKKSILSACLALFAVVSMYAQDITVQGTVVSRADDEPLIGATVMCNDTHKGTATDIDGNFTLTVPEGADLTISYVGYNAKTVKAEPKMMIYLDEDSELLDEVVVIGYQTIRKADLTGAVSVMDMKEPLSENSGNILNSMAGKMPGVNVVPDAAPGGSGSIRVRGMSSTRGDGNNPLYIIDGIPTENLDGINPSDIETMQVLKDAASASIYGSRAANGVIIVTTKHGKGDRMSITINYAITAQTMAKRYKTLSTEEWGRMYWMAAANANTPTSGMAGIYGNGASPVLQQFINGDTNYPVSNTDWQDQVYRTAWTNNLTATISNNSEKGSVLFSLNYINQNGNIIDTFYERYSARVNSRYDFNRFISVGENLLVTRWSNRGVDTGGDRGIPFTALAQHPALPVKGVDGTWSNPMALVSSDLANPAQLLANASDNDNTSWRILGNAFLEVKPVEGLVLKTNIGIEHSQYFTRTLNRIVNPGDRNSVASTYGQGDTWTWTNTANYNKTFNDKHHLTVLFGTEAIQYTLKTLDASRMDYAMESSDYMQVGAGQTIQSAGGGKSQWAVFSLFGKVDYNFEDRYLASFTIRHDENSRFAKGHRGGTFPAFSLAWRPSAEPWFPKNDVLADFKVRYSWGQNGNANIGQLYPAYSTYIWSTGNGAYDLAGSNNGTTSGLILSATGNPNLTWETTTQNNVGVDLSFLGGSVNLSGDFYVKKTTDMLTIPPVPEVNGENASIWLNTGSMRNIGWEVSLGYTSPYYGDFTWSGNINISQYKNKLLKLNDSQAFIGGDQRLIPGEPMGVYYGYVCDGIFQNVEQVANHAVQDGAEPGRLIYRDLNGDGIINDDDRCIIGDPNPDLSLGLNLAFKYKGFTLDMFFAGDFGQDIQNMMKKQLDFMSYGNIATNRGRDILNAWTPENPNADIPAVSLANNNNEYRFSTYYIQNGSYFKMKYLKLTYALPSKCLDKWAQSANVFFQVENVFTATKYKGLDPEILPGEYGALIDMGVYPRPRSFTLGLNLTF